MAKAVIVSAARTAIGTLAGALAQQPATKLGAVAVREGREPIVAIVDVAGGGPCLGRLRNEGDLPLLQY